MAFLCYVLLCRSGGDVLNNPGTGSIGIDDTHLCYGCNTGIKKL
jgi:hypothetical protein